MPSPDEGFRADTMAEAMADALENMAPILEAANGIRTRLMEMGWNEDAAEAAGVAFVQNAVAAMFE